MRRNLAESLERRKEMMIAALWANSGFEGQDGANTRRTAIEDLERHYDEAVDSVLTRTVETEDEEDIEDNPFFAAAKKGMKQIEQPRNDEGSVAQAITSEDDRESVEVDQA